MWIGRMSPLFITLWVHSMWSPIELLALPNNSTMLSMFFGRMHSLFQWLWVWEVWCWVRRTTQCSASLRTQNRLRDQQLCHHQSRLPETGMWWSACDVANCHCHRCTQLHHNGSISVQWQDCGIGTIRSVASRFLQSGTPTFCELVSESSSGLALREWLQFTTFLLLKWKQQTQNRKSQK